MFIRTLALGAILVAFLGTALGEAEVNTTAHASATSRGLVIDTGRFFPLMLIDQCTAQDVAQGKALGINLVLNESCPGLTPDDLLALLRGSGLAVLPIGARRTRGPGLVGWTYPDEPDNNGWTPASLAKADPYDRGNVDGLVTFLTTTGRFFRSGSVRLPTDPAFALRSIRGDGRHGRVRPLPDERLSVGSDDGVRRAAGVREARGHDPDLPVDRDGADPADLLWRLHHDARGVDRGGVAGGHRRRSGNRLFHPHVVPGARFAGTLAAHGDRDEADQLASRGGQAGPARHDDQVERRQSGRQGGGRSGGGRTYVFAINAMRSPNKVGIHVPQLHDGLVTVLGEGRTVIVENHYG